METIGSQAKKIIKAYPEKIAVKFQDIEITYADLFSRAMALASYLSEIGLKKGDRFGILMSNRHEFVEMDLATAFGGYIKVPVNYRLHPKEIDYMIENAGMSIIIGEEKLLNAIDTDIPKLYIGDNYNYEVISRLGQIIEVDVNEDDLFAIMYTSGTTGKPKGVMLSHRNVLTSALSLNYACEMNKNDIIGHVAPLTHGSNFLSHVAWFHGNTQVIYNKFQPEEFLDLIFRDKITVIFLVPTMVNLMIQHPDFSPDKLKSLKSINMAGSPIASSKLELALGKIGPKLVETYGQMEAPMCITVMLRDEIFNRLDSCGRPGPFIDIKIIGQDGEEQETGEIGEIVCQGSLVMQGYWNNPEATKNTLVDGWLRTGDLGWVDSRGYLSIVDRIKEVIISGGINIYPREIEEVLNMHEGVKETAVIGVLNDKWGESVTAFVVPNGTKETKIEDLLELCKNNLASFKKPKEIIIIDNLPKNAYGKILKRELQNISISKNSQVLD